MTVDWGIPDIRERMGEALRVVAGDDESGYSIENGRTDLDRAVVDRSVAAVYEQLTWDWSPPAESATRTLGGAYATIAGRTEAVIVTLRLGDTEVLSPAPSVTTDLVGFLGELLNRADAATGSLPES